MAASHCTPREHIERIRRERYYIGKEEKNPLAEDIHQAVNYLSEELYSKDVHFLMELIQALLFTIHFIQIYVYLKFNAEDNKYVEGVTPSLEFVITSKDITMSGSKSTLLIFNNEIGFSPANIDSICRIGKSTKKGSRHLGYIGEKGIGFKSVFLISSKPHIFSNGYQIRFDEEPSPDCNLGYIVPEWVEENPSLSDICNIYGPSKCLPTTTIILPLKSEKEAAVKKQLSNLHPEVLLFLSKIRQLSVREHNGDPNHNTVSHISISSEANYQMKKNVNAESYTLILAAEEDDEDEGDQCCVLESPGTQISGRFESIPEISISRLRSAFYYLWKQKFPVKHESFDKKRMGVDEWVITLAFPYGRRLNRGMISSGVYSFLPTEMVSGFPFIIQADFLLVSSRESICEDNPWNKGILDCVPSAFLNAFITLVKGAPDAPSFSVPFLFNFIPVETSPIQILDSVRESIREKLVVEHIIPCESYTSQQIFCKPSEISRLLPAFWSVLNKAQKFGVDIRNLHSHGRYIVNSYFDNEDYDQVLIFLGVNYVDIAWYEKFIKSCNLAKQASEEVYLGLLNFIAHNWDNCFNDLPLLKFINASGDISLLSVSRARSGNQRLCIAHDPEHVSWLIDWNQEFIAVSNQVFMPQSTQTYLRDFQAGLQDWLEKSVKLKAVSVYAYGENFVKALSNKRYVIAFTHFLYHSISSKYASDWCLGQLCSSLPIVDEYGYVVTRRTEVLVPAKVSNWVRLLGANPWKSENHVVLSSEYLSPANFAGKHTPEHGLLKFLQLSLKASDIPHVHPPNAAFASVYSPLTKENAFLLLDWIHNIKSRKTDSLYSFLNCIKQGSWLKTSIGYKPPSHSFLSRSDWGVLLQTDFVLVDIPLIDQEFYGERILEYTEELKFVGVQSEFWQASEYIGKHLMNLAANFTLTRGNVFSLLNLIRYLREKHMSPDYLIRSVKDQKWLKTSHGYRSPSESILLDSEWKIAAQVVDGIPLIDNTFYGDRIRSYEAELQKLGVRVTIDDISKIVSEQLKHLVASSSISSKNVLALFATYRQFRKLKYKFPDALHDFITNAQWLHTCLGFRCPQASILFNSEWEALLHIASLPLIDGNSSYYGNSNDIYEYKNELKEFGVAVEFKDGAKFAIAGLSIPKNPSAIRPASVLSLLKCIQNADGKMESLPNDFMKSIKKRWLKTTMGFKSPEESILFDFKWGLQKEDGPFIDDIFYGPDVLSYKDEMKKIGVVVDAAEGCMLLANHIRCHSDISAISRVYMHLYQFKWEPENQAADWIWIPDKGATGQWVSSSNCILHDKVNLFGSQLIVLDQYYETKLLGFFSSVLWVRLGPNTEDYCKLWCSWEASSHHITFAQCSAFWSFIAKHWDSKTEKLVLGCISKLPVQKINDIILSEKLDAFIPDDLLLKDLFDRLSDEAIFVWYPPTYMPALSRVNLNKIYSCIGARPISEAVEKDESESFTATGANVRKVDPRSLVLKTGFLKIVLAFLCDASLNISSAERCRIVKKLHGLEVLGVDEHITVSCKVSLSSGKTLVVKASRMCRWVKDYAKLFIQRVDESTKRGIIEFSTYFAHVIAEGLLSEMPGQITALAELVKLGSLLDFQDDAVDFLLKTKNLHMFAEDEEFLSSLTSCSA
ncbi:hypothetical protein Cni_G20222 [Canna indica]|uniref:Sacsin n=1 Tax=Canna indica TaxID=4628 RepID=A0AAQ3QHK7_9LILI|nr:hypothetical protein Cni_G20222 [Canna indica]